MKFLFVLAIALISSSSIAAQVCGKVAGDCDNMLAPTHQFITTRSTNPVQVYNLIAKTPAVEAQLCDWRKLGPVCLDGDFTDQVISGFQVVAVLPDQGK